MNKALHAIVYLILLLAGAALYFEMNIFDKRSLQNDSITQLADYIVKISHTIEKSDAPKTGTVPEARKDISAVEAKAVDTPETENLLEDYAAHLESQNLETFKWDDGERAQLRKIYLLDPEGKKVPNPANPGEFVTKGKGTASELLEQLFDRAKAQQAHLNETRAELATVRAKLETLTGDYNKLKPPARQSKIEIEELKGKVEATEKERDAAREQVTKIKGQIEDLNSEITSLKDEVSSAKDETEAVKEDLAKEKQNYEQLKKLFQQVQAQAQAPAAGATGNGAAITTLSAGDKGKVVEVNNEYMFAVIEFTDAAIKELLGENRQSPLPRLELGIRRKVNGADKYIGRMKLRQSVAGKNFVIADILGDWQQAPVEKGDAVFAE
ncbi:MAG: hypothetical protein IKO72_06400 [Kiritimatiellae bacterium]|nr:hypothetical protein [Kiritimatiellia bacterium]